MKTLCEQWMPHFWISIGKTNMLDFQNKYLWENVWLCKFCPISHGLWLNWKWNEIDLLESEAAPTFINYIFHSLNSYRLLDYLTVFVNLTLLPSLFVFSNKVKFRWLPIFWHPFPPILNGISFTSATYVPHVCNRTYATYV